MDCQSKEQNNLIFDTSPEHLELINNLLKIFDDYMNFGGCTVFDNYNEVIEDDIYKLACYMNSNGADPCIAQICIRNKILSSNLNDTLRIRAEIIADWSYCFPFLYLERASKIIMHSNIDIKYLFKNVPCICMPYDNHGVSQNFLEMTKDYSDIKKDYEEYRFIAEYLSKYGIENCNELLIKQLGIVQTTILICGLDKAEKRNLLKHLPMPFILGMMDLMSNFKPSLEDIKHAQKEFCKVLAGHSSLRNKHNTLNTTLEISKLLINIDSNSKKSLRKLRDELIAVYPKPFDSYKPLTEYVYTANEQLIYIIYELFLFNIPSNVIDQTIAKYIISNDYSREEQLKAVLFTIFIICIQTCDYNYEIVKMILDSVVEA